MRIYAETRLAAVLEVPAMNFVRPFASTLLKPTPDAFTADVRRAIWSPTLIGDTEPVTARYDDGTGGCFKLKAATVDQASTFVAAAHMLLNAMESAHGRKTRCLLYGGPLFDCRFDLAAAFGSIRDRLVGACYTIDIGWLKTPGAVERQLDLYARAASAMGILREETWICIHPYGAGVPAPEKQSWMLAAATLVERKGMNLLLVNGDVDPSPWADCCRQLVKTLG